MTMVLDSQIQTEMLCETKQAQDYLSVLKVLEIRTVEQYDDAAEALAQIKGDFKRIDAKKKSVTDPLNKALKELRSWFDPPLGYLSECEIYLKKAIAGYHVRKDEANRLAMEAASAAVAVGDTEALQVAVESISSPEKVSGLSVREVWDYEVVDGSKVPRDLLSVDDFKVKAWIKMFDGVEPALAVPGLRFFKKAIVSSRSK